MEPRLGFVVGKPDGGACLRKLFDSSVHPEKLTEKSPNLLFERFFVRIVLGCIRQIFETMANYANLEPWSMVSIQIIYFGGLII